MCTSQLTQSFDLGIRQDVARGICRPRDTDGPNLVGDVHPAKVDVIFEEAIVDVTDLRFIGNKQIVRQTHVTISNVLRGEWKQYLLFGPVCKSSGENVKQNEKRRLTAVRQSNILGLYVPAELVSEQGCNDFGKFPVAAGWIVLPEGSFKLAPLAQKLCDAIPKRGLNAGYMRGISSPQHQNVRTGRNSIAQILHELTDTGCRCNFLTEPGYLHHTYTSTEQQGVRKYNHLATISEWSIAEAALL